MAEDIEMFGVANQEIIAAKLAVEREVISYRKKDKKAKARQAKKVLNLIEKARSEHNEIARIV